MMKRARGFTLLELMIVVAVIAILAGIAISAYSKQVRKSRRADAKQLLVDASLRQEKWRSTHVEYIGTNSAPADITTFGSLTLSSAQSFYNATVSSVKSPTDYTLTAVPKPNTDQAKDTCGTLTFRSQSGVVQKLPATGGCW